MAGEKLVSFVGFVSAASDFKNSKKSVSLYKNTLDGHSEEVFRRGILLKIRAREILRLKPSSE